MGSFKIGNSITLYKRYMAPVPLVGNWYLGMLRQLQQPLAINRRIFFISHTAELTACTSTGILFVEIGSIVPR